MEATEAMVGFKSTIAESGLYLNTKKWIQTNLRFGEIPDSTP